jgi:hypothetical protein
MSTAAVSNLGPEVIVLVFIVLILARRTYAQIQGARFSAERLAVFAGFYVLLFAALAAGTLYAALSAWGTPAYLLVLPYVAVPGVSALMAAPYIQRVVRFELRADGNWYYRLSWHIPVLYLGLFVARIAAEVAVFGGSAVLVTFPPPSPPSLAALYLLVGVDLLFGISLGLLIGRGFGVYRAHRALPPAEGAPPPPLPGA